MSGSVERPLPTPQEPPQLSRAQYQFLVRLRFESAHVTYLIIALNILLFALLQLGGGSSNPKTLIEFGARYNPLISQGEYWRLVSNIFLHAGYLHILCNMYGLFSLGSIIERLYGPARFLFLYLVSGLAGSVASWLLTPNLSLGASGAVFGIAGVLITYGFKHRDTIPHQLAASFGRGAVPFVALNLFLGFSHPQIDNYAHVGGLLAGMIISAVMNPAADRHSVGRFGLFGWRDLLIQGTAVGMLLYTTVAAAHRYFPLHQRHQAESLLHSGERLLRQGRFQEGLERFRQAQQILPSDPLPSLELAGGYLRMGVPDEALNHAQEALRLDSRSDRAHLILGMGLARKGETDRAISSLQRAIDLNPDLVQAYTELGRIYLLQKEDQAASRVFEKLVQARPDGVSFESVGTLYLSKGRAERAVPYLRKATELLPDSTRTHLLLGAALQQVRQTEEAIESYEKALAGKETSQAAKAALISLHAQVSLEAGRDRDWNRAQQEAEAILKLDPTNAQGHLILGSVLADRGDHAGAVREFESYLQLAPDASNRDQVKKQLSRLRRLES
ncbi:MAG: rhomboid family intramembrane serine protease [Acidobacteriota bacterium]